MRVAKAFKKLGMKIQPYILQQRRTVKSIIMGQLFQKIELVEDGGLNFTFPTLQHHIFFEPQQNFYTLKLRELSMIKSKYTMITLKLIEAKRFEIEIQSISKVQ